MQFIVGDFTPSTPSGVKQPPPLPAGQPPNPAMNPRGVSDNGLAVRYLLRLAGDALGALGRGELGHNAEGFGVKQAIKKVIPVLPVKVATDVLFTNPNAGGPDARRPLRVKVYDPYAAALLDIDPQALIAVQMLEMWLADP